MSKAIAIKPEEDFARSYVDGLILEKLTEIESAIKLGELAEKLEEPGLGLATVRSLLASRPEVFAYHERRWIPATRLESGGRPFNEIVALVLGAFGRPIRLSLLALEVARVRRAGVEETEAILRRVLDRNPNFVLLADERVALLDWGFNAGDETTERALALNQIAPETLQKAHEALKGIDWREEGAVAKAVAKAAPISLKALGAVAWQSVNSQDPRSVLIYDAADFLREALSLPGYLLGPDGTLYPAAEAKKWVTTAVKVAEKIAPTVEVEDAAPIEVGADDIGKLVAKVLASSESVTATKMLEDLYEITPSNKTFPDDLENVMVGLKGQGEIQWVGGDRFRKAGEIPDFVDTLPEPFQFTSSDLVDEEGELVDVELTDEGLSSSLRKLLGHPLATDVLDEDILPAPRNSQDTLRLVLKHIHRELGTFPLSQVPTGWLDAEPKLQELILIDPNGRELQAWANMETRLIYNLVDWWYEQPVESGAVFSLTKTIRPNVLEFTWLDQPDPVVYISNQRMEELREIARSAEGKSTFELLTEVMQHWPKGADYLTIHAEINVVRRSTRRLIASLLSSYHCFYQRSGSPVWHFDAKKVELGFDKTKRKFVKK